MGHWGVGKRAGPARTLSCFLPVIIQARLFSSFFQLWPKSRFLLSSAKEGPLPQHILVAYLANALELEGSVVVVSMWLALRFILLVLGGHALCGTLYGRGFTNAFNFQCSHCRLWGAVPHGLLDLHQWLSSNAVGLIVNPLLAYFMQQRHGVCWCGKHTPKRQTSYGTWGFRHCWFLKSLKGIEDFAFNPLLYKIVVRVWVCRLQEGESRWPDSFQTSFCWADHFLPLGVYIFL